MQDNNDAVIIAESVNRVKFYESLAGIEQTTKNVAFADRYIVTINGQNKLRVFLIQMSMSGTEPEFLAHIQKEITVASLNVVPSMEIYSATVQQEGLFVHLRDKNTNWLYRMDTQTHRVSLLKFDGVVLPIVKHLSFMEGFETVSIAYVPVNSSQVITQVFASNNDLAAQIGVVQNSTLKLETTTKNAISIADVSGKSLVSIVAIPMNSSKSAVFKRYEVNNKGRMV